MKKDDINKLLGIIDEARLHPLDQAAVDRHTANIWADEARKEARKKSGIKAPSPFDEYKKEIRNQEEVSRNRRGIYTIGRPGKEERIRITPEEAARAQYRPTKETSSRTVKFGEFTNGALDSNTPKFPNIAPENQEYFDAVKAKNDSIKANMRNIGKKTKEEHDSRESEKALSKYALQQGGGTNYEPLFNPREPARKVQGTVQLPKKPSNVPSVDIKYNTRIAYPTNFGVPGEFSYHEKTPEPVATPPKAEEPTSKVIQPDQRQVSQPELDFSVPHDGPTAYETSKNEGNKARWERLKSGIRNSAEFRTETTDPLHHLGASLLTRRISTAKSIEQDQTAVKNSVGRWNGENAHEFFDSELNHDHNYYQSNLDAATKVSGLLRKGKDVDLQTAHLEHASNMAQITKGLGTLVNAKLRESLSKQPNNKDALESALFVKKLFSRATDAEAWNVGQEAHFHATHNGIDSGLNTQGDAVHERLTPDRSSLSSLLHSLSGEHDSNQQAHLIARHHPEAAALMRTYARNIDEQNKRKELDTFNKHAKPVIDKIEKFANKTRSFIGGELTHLRQMPGKIARNSWQDEGDVHEEFEQLTGMTAMLLREDAAAYDRRVGLARTIWGGALRMGDIDPAKEAVQYANPAWKTDERFSIKDRNHAQKIHKVISTVEQYRDSLRGENVPEHIRDPLHRTINDILNVMYGGLHSHNANVIMSMNAVKSGNKPPKVFPASARPTIPDAASLHDLTSRASDYARDIGAKKLAKQLQQIAHYNLMYDGIERKRRAAEEIPANYGLDRGFNPALSKLKSYMQGELSDFGSDLIGLSTGDSKGWQERRETKRIRELNKAGWKATEKYNQYDGRQNAVNMDDYELEQFRKGNNALFGEGTEDVNLNKIFEGISNLFKPQQPRGKVLVTKLKFLDPKYGIKTDDLQEQTVFKNFQQTSNKVSHKLEENGDITVTEEVKYKIPNQRPLLKENVWEAWNKYYTALWNSPAFNKFQLRENEGSKLSKSASRLKFLVDLKEQMEYARNRDDLEAMVLSMRTTYAVLEHFGWKKGPSKMDIYRTTDAKHIAEDLMKKYGLA